MSISSLIKLIWLSENISYFIELRKNFLQDIFLHIYFKSFIYNYVRPNYIWCRFTLLIKNSLAEACYVLKRQNWIIFENLRCYNMWKNTWILQTRLFSITYQLNPADSYHYQVLSVYYYIRGLKWCVSVSCVCLSG